MTEKEYALAQAVREAAQNASTQDLEATQLVSLEDLKELERLQLAGAAQTKPARRRRQAAVLAAACGLMLAAALLAMLLAAHTRQEAQAHAAKTLHWGGR